MSKIARDLTELVGKTPMVRLNKLNTGGAEVLLKLEYFNRSEEHTSELQSRE